MKNFETEKFYLVGNNLALDFANSLMFELTRENLLGWAIAADLVAPEQAENLLPKWDEAQLAKVSDFRELLRGLFINLADGKKIRQFEIEALNKILRQPGGFSSLKETPEGFVKHFEIEFSAPSKILFPIAESMVDLLCFGDLAYLRKCETPQCVLYFYDTTKNHRRRWCSMAICGNRAKAAKFYQKTKMRS